MDLSLALLADYAAQDAAGKLYIIGVFGILNAPGFPAIHPLMHLVLRFSPELGEYDETRKLKVTLVDEDGTQVFQVTGDIHIPPQVGSTRPDVNAIFSLRDLTFPKGGLYEFRIYLDKDQKGSVPLQVTQIDASKNLE